MEKVRSEDGYTIGEAFQVAMIETAQEWTVPQQQPVQTGNNNQQHQQHQQRDNHDQRSPKGKGDAKGKKDKDSTRGPLPKAKKDSTNKSPVEVTKSGKKICRDFNSDKGCRSPCKHGHIHCCNVRKTDNAACGHTGHGRPGHIWNL